MATPDGIRSFGEEIPLLGVSVGLTDDRDQARVEKDSATGIEHVTGDISESGTYRDLLRTLKGRKEG